MPLSERNSVVFAYESSVHSANVLHSLDEQRKQDLFCDVTILVEDQRFRAHCSVLSACSIYFRSRIVGHLESDLVVILPEEVTLKGFEPLLQFAYTSKLILDKDNVVEVCKCAEFLGIHDIEESCFQFLKFRFLDHKPGQQEYPKKKCCKSRCQKEYSKVGGADSGDLEIDYVDEIIQNECVKKTQLKVYKNEENSEVFQLQDNSNQTQEYSPERDHDFGIESLCPKYRKFQKALESDKTSTLESSSGIKEVHVASINQAESNIGGAIQKPLECTAVCPSSKCEEAQIKMEENGEQEFMNETSSVFQSTECSTEKMDSTFVPHNSSVATHGLSSFLNEEAKIKMEENGKQEFMNETSSVFQSTECSTEKMDSAFVPHNSSVATHGLSSSFLNEEAQIKMEENGKQEFMNETSSVFRSTECSTEKMDSTFVPHNSSVATHGLYSSSFLNEYDQYCNLTCMQSNTVAEKNDIVTEAGNCKSVSESPAEGPSLKSHLCDPADVSSTSPSHRSSVEREIAEQLAKGFWSDVYNSNTACQVNVSPALTKELSEQSCSEKKTECPWLEIRILDSPEHGPPRTFTTLSSVTCPFISNLSTESTTEVNSGDYVPEQQPEPCPYTCVINLEEDSESDTEGDSESFSAREQECEVKLPFNPQKIISLSRNDFQSFVKMHKLTPEELDCIHDIRRRSKNRIAAQRCRKRKIDCIQNLESEIEKLQNEKEKLLKEKDNILSTLAETKQNLTGLCQQVFKEAALSNEQIQILAKYSAADCPLSYFVPEWEQAASSEIVSAVPLCVELSAGLSVVSANEPSASYQHMKGTRNTGYDQARELCPVPVRISEKTLCLEQCVKSGSGITDFCQQMTDKCTTDE